MHKTANTFIAVIKAFDKFIESTGGNKDPRAACNRDRKALYSFFKDLMELSPGEVEKMMELVIEKKVTSHNIDGSEGFPQYDENENPSPSAWLVYEWNGRLLGIGRG